MYNINIYIDILNIICEKNHNTPTPLVIVSTSKILWRQHFMTSHRAYYRWVGLFVFECQ